MKGADWESAPTAKEKGVRPMAWSDQSYLAVNPGPYSLLTKKELYNTVFQGDNLSPQEVAMAFWNKKTEEDPEKQFKKLKKYCMQVMGLDKEAAEKKAREWLNSVGSEANKLKDLPK
jgi:hypothetical protein